MHASSENSATPVVFVIDDDSAVRKGLCRFLRSVGLDAEGFESAEAFLDCQSNVRPSCLVLDINMPGISGLALQEQLASRGLAPAIVFLTGVATVPMGIRAMKKGAIDFLQKPFKDEDLLDAVQRAIDTDAENQLMEAEYSSIQERYAKLTPREVEVFELVAEGLLNKQVASRLGAAEKTIKVHRGRVMSKMNAASLADLVRMSERLLPARGPE